MPMTHDNGGKKSGSAVQVTVLVGAVVIIVATLGGAVALSLAGREVSAIVGLIGPVGAAAALLVATLGKLVQLDRKTDEQTAKIEQVAEQTNGALRQHIDESIRAALDTHLGDRTER